MRGFVQVSFLYFYIIPCCAYRVKILCYADDMLSILCFTISKLLFVSFFAILFSVLMHTQKKGGRTLAQAQWRVDRVEHKFFISPSAAAKLYGCFLTTWLTSAVKPRGSARKPESAAISALARNMSSLPMRSTDAGTQSSRSSLLFPI